MTLVAAFIAFALAGAGLWWLGFTAAWKATYYTVTAVAWLVRAVCSLPVRLLARVSRRPA